ncbi:hypothetical protein L3X38_032038 [Prunus dulcis]|uniref:Uncharacterized protein n=1 Tax=Prunus dulcis TaxID=3755 RepID=A0AAD4VFG4_PRUDU|nr:hypothetical protein L3X38_032038 [Prunus dulcis]
MLSFATIFVVAQDFGAITWTLPLLCDEIYLHDCPPVAAAVHTLKEPCVSDSEDSDATDSEMLPGASEGSLVF